MLFAKEINSALEHKWTAIYAKFLTIVLFYGATVHLANILGLAGTPWRTTPIL